jgi:membrane-associated phospholipid phosphatase
VLIDPASASSEANGILALSCLVLGVHRPTDVLAAACIGAAIPLALSLGVAFNRH